MSAAKVVLPIAPVRTGGVWVFDFLFYSDAGLNQPEDWTGRSATMAFVPRSPLLRDKAFKLTNEDGGLVILVNGVGVRLGKAGTRDLHPTSYDWELSWLDAEGEPTRVLVGGVVIEQGLDAIVDGEPVVGALSLSGGASQVVKAFVPAGVVQVVQGAGAVGRSAYQVALENGFEGTEAEYASRPIDAAEAAIAAATNADGKAQAAQAGAEAANQAAEAASQAIAQGRIGLGVLEVNSPEYTLQPADLGLTVLFTSAAAVRVLVPAGLGDGFNCRLVQGGGGSVAAIAAGASLLAPGLRAATSEIGEVMTLLPIGVDAYQIQGSAEPSFYQRLDAPMSAADVAVVDAFRAALEASGAAIQATFLPCLSEPQEAVTCLETAAHDAVVVGSPVWTPYRGFGVATITDAVAVPGLSGGAWYTRRTDAVPFAGDRLGVAVYGVLDAGQQAAFEAAADGLLTAVGAKNTGRTADLIAQCGQSLFANGQSILVSGTLPEVRLSDRGELIWMQFFGGGAFRMPTKYAGGTGKGVWGGNFAIGGGGLEGQLTDQVPYIIASKALFCALEVGRNDFNVGLLWDNYVKPKYKEIANALRRGGVTPIHFGNFQRDSRYVANWGPGSVARIETQKCIEEMPAYVEGLGEPFVERYSVVTDPAAAVPGDLRDGWFVDGIHMTNLGAQGVGLARANVLQAVFGPGPSLATHSVGSVGGTRSITDRTLSAGTKPTAPAPFTGVVPTGHTLAQSATSNVAVNGDWITGTGGVDWWEMTVTSAGVVGAALEALTLTSTFMTGIVGSQVLISWDVELEDPNGVLQRFDCLGQGGGSSGSRPRIRGFYHTDPDTPREGRAFSGRVITDAVKITSPSAQTAQGAIVFRINPQMAGVTKIRLRGFVCKPVGDPQVEFPLRQ